VSRLAHSSQVIDLQAYRLADFLLISAPPTNAGHGAGERAIIRPLHCQTMNTILIIEDNPEERKIFSTYLKFAGMDLIEASNGEEGLRMAQDHNPDVILMDINMPVMNGWETAIRLKSDPGTTDIPLIAITAHNLPPERLEQAGFCAYLEKPLAPYRVLEEVERCIGPLDADSADEVKARTRGRAG
jgi:CheY-like chemotaxis protein